AEDAGAAVSRRHHVRLPAAAGTGGVAVQVTVQGSGAQISQCNSTSAIDGNCDGLGTVGASTSFTIPSGSNFGYFDLIGGGTTVTDTRLNYPGDVAVDGSGAIYFADYNNYRVRKLSGGVLS